MIWLLPPPFRGNKLSLFFCLPVCRRSSSRMREGEGGGRGAKNHTTARKPGPLSIIQYSLDLSNEKAPSTIFGDRDPAEGSSHQRTNPPLSLSGSMWVSADGRWIRWFWLEWQHALLCCVRQLELVFFFSVPAVQQWVYQVQSPEKLLKLNSTNNIAKNYKIVIFKNN